MTRFGDCLGSFFCFCGSPKHSSVKRTEEVERDNDEPSEQLQAVVSMGLSGSMVLESENQDALNIPPNDRSQEADRLGELGLSLWKGFERFGNVGDLEKAITAHQQALNLTPDDHPSKPTQFHNLGLCLLSRFERLGNVGDLEKAITAHQQALNLTPDDHPDKPAQFNNLGLCLRRRFERLGNVEDLEKAIIAHQQALNLTPNDHPDKPSRFNNLGSALESRFERLGNLADLVHAVSCFSAAATATSGHPLVRLRSAREWARLSRTQQSPTSVLDAHNAVMALIPQIAWLGHSLQNRYRELVSLGNASNQAAAAAIEAGNIERALEWLEEGRAIVWSQILQLRTPLDDLRAVAPEIAKELQAVSAQLESSGEWTDSEIPSISDRTVGTSLSQRGPGRYTLALRHEELIKQARTLPGFADFLQPKLLNSLRYAAKCGPVVVINVDESRCDALVLPDISGRVIHIPLPDLTHSIAAEMQSRLVHSLKKSGVRERGTSGSLSSDVVVQPLQDALVQLWRLAVRPILATLDYLVPRSAGSALPRLTWCATGPLAFLPLHAAGIYDPNVVGEKALHYVVSSYTPSLGTLLENQRQRPAGSQPRLLATSVPQTATPGMGRLRHTIAEINGVQRYIRALPFTWLTDADATKQSVLRYMEDHSWIHLACHGTQDATDPTKSAFHLYDGPLELSEIMGKSWKHTELAVLSACQTAKGDVKLPEESVHLAAGMLMAGYRSVVGTMWSISDEDGPVVSLEFYRYLKDVGYDSTQSAYALHRAVEVLRERVGERNFGRWVSFVHYGA